MEKSATIVAGCKRGDSRYQRVLYEKYRRAALKIVFRYIYNYEEAVEVTNDGFVKVFKSIEKFIYEREADIDKLLWGWIRRIMINTSIDLLRKKMLLPEIGGIPEHVWDRQDGSPSAEQKIVYKELIMMIKNLPPAYRIVFNMQVIDGYKHIEIAEILGIPVGTSKSHLMRAKNLLQKHISQKESIIECSI